MIQTLKKLSPIDSLTEISAFVLLKSIFFILFNTIFLYLLNFCIIFFLETEKDKEENLEKAPDANDNHCDNATDNSIEEITDKSDGKDEPCDDMINTVNVEISIEEARNLPFLKSQGDFSLNPLRWLYYY